MVTLQKFQNALPVYRVLLQSCTQRRWVFKSMPKEVKNPSISGKIILFPENRRIHLQNNGFLIASPPPSSTLPPAILLCEEKESI